MSEYRVRQAVQADAAAICRIYNQGIEDRVATLETELRTPDERRQWLAARGPRHPVIIAETTEPGATPDRPPTERAGHAGPARTEPGAVPNRPPTERAGHAGPATTEPGATPDRPPTDATTIAWGSLNQYNPRDCYRHVADFSIYVERSYRGKGVGRVLLARLIELAREHGYHKLVLSAFPTNTGGVALYEKMGFRTVGIYKEQGLLDGRWVDTIIMEKLL